MSAPKGWTGIEAGNEQGHTPLPWKYDGAGYGNIRPMIEDGRNVCTFTRAFSLTEQMMNDANARFICKAVNCHDDLVAALSECRDALAEHVELESRRTGQPQEVVCPCKTTTIAKANAILKKAGEA